MWPRLLAAGFYRGFIVSRNWCRWGRMLVLSTATDVNVWDHFLADMCWSRWHCVTYRDRLTVACHRCMIRWLAEHRFTNVWFCLVQIWGSGPVPYFDFHFRCLAQPLCGYPAKYCGPISLWGPVPVVVEPIHHLCIKWYASPLNWPISFCVVVSALS